MGLMEEFIVEDSEIIDKAKRYYSELPPHAKERKGGFYIKRLIESLETKDRKLNTAGYGELNRLRRNERNLEDMLIGADFLIKKLSFERDLSLGMEDHINDFQEDMKPIISRMSQAFEG